MHTHSHTYKHHTQANRRITEMHSCVTRAHIRTKAPSRLSSLRANLEVDPTTVRELRHLAPPPDPFCVCLCPHPHVLSLPNVAPRNPLQRIPLPSRRSRISSIVASLSPHLKVRERTLAQCTNVQEWIPGAVELVFVTPLPYSRYSRCRHKGYGKSTKRKKARQDVQSQSS